MRPRSSYQMSHRYVPDAARGVRWDDSAIGIEWPAAEERIISERDRAWPDLAADDPSTHSQGADLDHLRLQRPGRPAALPRSLDRGAPRRGDRRVPADRQRRRLVRDRRGGPQPRCIAGEHDHLVFVHQDVYLHSLTRVGGSRGGPRRRPSASDCSARSASPRRGSWWAGYATGSCCWASRRATDGRRQPRRGAVHDPARPRPTGAALRGPRARLARLRDRVRAPRRIARVARLRDRHPSDPQQRHA